MNNYVVVCKKLYMVKVLDDLGSGGDWLTKFLYSLLILCYQHATWFAIEQGITISNWESQMVVVR